MLFRSETFRGLPTRVTVEQTRELSLMELEAARAFYDRLVPTQDRAGVDDALLAMGVLDDRELAVIEMRCGFHDDPKTNVDCGRMFGISSQRVSQLYRRAARKMKHALAQSHASTCR